MFVNKVFVIATLAISALAAPAIVELEERAPEPGIKSAFINLKHKIEHKIEDGKAKGLYRHATKVIGKNSAKVHATIAITSVGGPAITLATGKHGVKTTFAGHEWKVATATPSPSVSKRAEDLEARRIHLFRKKSKAQRMAEHANRVIGKKHTAQVHATIATVSGKEIVQVTSVGGPAITLATKGGIKTKFAGHEWHIVTATPTPSHSSSVASATPSKRALELEERDFELEERDIELEERDFDLEERSLEEYIEARDAEASAHTNGSPASFVISKPILAALAGVLGSIATGALVVL
ncbi:hypothetical protein NLI96_g1907 [Meripilus lineatus]|uniref:Uncharacterized protein n=1 Tax=Meripilus lineatus TaxID=2056292 RepID=A0AAD5VE15_9APHY|nr:hypothetical protein NLI96_g1907 [Physisporinus lineatus]